MKDPFQRTDGWLHAEGVPVARIADEVSRPVDGTIGFRLRNWRAHHYLLALAIVAGLVTLLYRML